MFKCFSFLKKDNLDLLNQCLSAKPSEISRFNASGLSMCLLCFFSLCLTKNVVPLSNLTVVLLCKYYV